MFKETEANIRPTRLNWLYKLEVPAGVPIILNDIYPRLIPGVQVEELDRAVDILIRTVFKPTEVMYAKSNTFSTDTQGIIQKMVSSKNPESTVIIWPGEGAKSVFQSVYANIPELNYFMNIFAPTSRIVENGKVRGVIPEFNNYWSVLTNPDVTEILIVDDVISTGTTINTIMDQIRLNRDQPINFSACTWFLRQPTNAGNNGITEIQSVWKYMAVEGYPALNSLSTLLRTDQKGQVVRDSYKQKYIKYPYGFDKQIDYIRSLIQTGETI
jgi:hypothetical protein